MATVIPNPVRIACTECHRDARVEFQCHETWNDALIVAAECDCGRFIAEVDGFLFRARGLGTQLQPLIASSLRHIPELGVHAKERVVALRDRMAQYERVIAAATWANDRPRAEPSPPAPATRDLT